MARRRTGKQRHREHRGHYCWGCDRRLPNERFSGKGHARHICRECQKLGPDELAYRSVVRDIERWMRYLEHLPRKRRRSVQRLLDHPDLRLRAWAEELLTGVPVGDHVLEFADRDELDRFIEQEWIGEPAEFQEPVDWSEPPDYIAEFNWYLEWIAD